MTKTYNLSLVDVDNITINEVHYNDVMFDISKCDFEVTKGMPYTIDQIMFDNILLNIYTL